MNGNKVLDNSEAVVILSNEQIDEYLEAIAEEIFKQSTLEHLTSKKLGVIRISLISRRNSDSVVKDNFKALDNRLRALMGLEVLQ